MMKYTHVTRKTSCDRKYTSCDKRSICHRRIFSCEINNISCDRKFISCDRNEKEHLVSQYTFPVNERIFTVTGNEYPVIGLGETHQSLINLLVSTRLWGLSFNGLKKTPIFDFLCPMSKWAGAISTLIPWLCISAQSCSWLQLYVDYCLDDDTIFPVVSGEIIYWKIRFPGNFKFYPTLSSSKPY